MDQAKEFLEMPREFVKDGRQFITRCSKRTLSSPSKPSPSSRQEECERESNSLTRTPRTADKREFLRISQAVGMGFLIMGVIGYIVKLSKSSASFLLFYSLLWSRLQQRWSCDQEQGQEEGKEGGNECTRDEVSFLFLHSELTYLFPSLTVHIPVNNILVGGA
jgi:protein transport protein SEC61 subunit gamma-like protein